MKQDDECLINERLDAEHACFDESKWISDGDVADQAMELIVVRDLVANLSRDQRVNVAPRVMRKIQARQWWRGVPLRIALNAVRGFPLTKLGTGLAVAATLAVIILVFMPRPQTTVAIPALVSVETTPTPIGTSKAVLPAIQPGVAPSTIAELPHRPADESTLVSGRAGKTEPAHDHFDASTRIMEQLTRLLDNQSLRQILVVSDGKDGVVQERVASLVEQTTRFDYFTITVAQGVVIDPLHPEKATVFAFVVNPTELANLRGQLKASLKTDLDETNAAAEIVTQLADIGQVKAFKPTVPAPIMIPRHEIALRTEPSILAMAETTGIMPDGLEGGASDKSSSLATRSASRLEAPAYTRSKVVRKGTATGSLTETRLGSGGAGEAAGGDDSIVVLVWVHGARSG